MKRNMLRFFPVLILLLLACNLSNAGTATASVPTPIPSETPPTAVTAFPPAGDLGFGNISGTVTDAATGSPIANATVTCVHFSYTSKESDRCNRTTTTDGNGVFLFEKVFFHDTDSITITVEAPGYEKTEIKNGMLTWNEWKVEITLKATQ